MTKNAFKGWLTTLIGVATMVLTLWEVYKNVFDFVWEGIGGLIVGSILIMAPQTIEKKLSEVIKAWGNKKSGSDWGGGGSDNDKPNYEI